MTRFNYAVSTFARLNDFVKYAVHPLFKTASWLHYHDHPNQYLARRKANLMAGVATAGFYTSLNTYFSNSEYQLLDISSRRAVAAELGKNVKDVQPADYWHSTNTIVAQEINDRENLMPLRYAVGSLPMLQSAWDYAAEAFPGMKEAIRYGREHKRGGKDPISIVAGAFNAWDMAVFAGMSAYWAYETYAVRKTGMYETVKLIETVQSVNKKFDANNLIGVFNRTREDQAYIAFKHGDNDYHDYHNAMLTREERNAIWPVLERMAEHMNVHKTTLDTENDKQFGIAEMVYLMGNGHIDLFERDDKGREVMDKQGHRIISQDAIKHSMEMVEHVADVGLQGVAEENRHKLAEERKTSFVSRVKEDYINKRTEIMGNVFGRPRRPVEYLSPRDHSEPQAAITHASL